MPPRAENSKRVALILRGPPGAGKTTLIKSLLAARSAAGETCARAHLDDGWGPGEVRRQGSGTPAKRYHDLVQRPETLLVVDLALAEPEFAQIPEPGASRAPNDWVDLLKKERDIVLVRLRVPWVVSEQRIRQRQPIQWFHPWGHAVISEDAWRFADTVGLPEVLIDATRAEAAVLQDVAALLPAVVQSTP